MPIRRPHLVRLALGLAAIVPLTVLAPAGVASGQAQPVDAQAAALSDSATCATGDIEITYSGQGVERQITTFTSADREVPLHFYDVHTYAPNHDGTEFILSQTRTPPPPGTIVAVHVTIGSSPPTVGSSGEFFVAYLCDDVPNSRGGHNEVVETCAGTYSVCPKSARDVVLVPTFTG